MKIGVVMIGVLVFSMVVLGSMTYLNELRDNYPEYTMNLSEMNRTTRNLQLIRYRSNETLIHLQRWTSEDVKEASYLTLMLDLWKTAWSSIYLMLLSIPVFLAVVTDSMVIIGTTVGLPGWVIPTITAIITVSIVLFLISAFIKWKVH